MNYTANDIVSLSAGRAFREKIGMYLTADRQEAINLGLRELIVNVQDEYEVYKPKNPRLSITLNSSTHEIIVEDNMRGIPVGVREDGMNSLTAAFLIPHSGGKHQEGAYSSAVGINGEGNKIVCHTAEWLEVQVMREGKIWFQRFESNDEGARAVTDVQIIGDCSDSTGTRIKYKPDSKVYDGCFIDVPKLRKMLEEISLFTKGLTIILNIDGNVETLLSKNGLIDGLSSDNILTKPFSYFYETEDCKVELALQWVTKGGEIKGYANGLFMPDGGAFITGFKTSLTRTFNSLAKQNYSGDTIRNILDGFVSVKVKVGQFSNQQKSSLANPEARSATSTAISNALKDFAIRQKSEFDKVLELLGKLAKAEAAAEKARKQVLEATKDIEKNQKRKVFSSDKLKDAEYLGKDSTLLLVEGLSAASSIAMARDEKKYGILALRGKMINGFSNSEDKFYNNEEVKLMLSAMNIVPNKYNSEKLRYGKIAICTDADADGYAIGLLIMCALYKVAPKFIEEGRLCWLRSPLYIVKKGKQESYFFTDEEFNSLKFISGTVQRNKGLGSLSADQAKNSMFAPENQRMEILMPDDGTLDLLDNLMGKDSQPKKDFIFSNLDFSEIKE